MLRIDDADRVRHLTLDRPDALNAFNEALYAATAEALRAAGRDPGVAVLLVTGTGRAFSAGTDVAEMAALASGPIEEGAGSGFPALVDELVAFPKPLVCAVNGLALGIGATMLVWPTSCSCRPRPGCGARSRRWRWRRRRRAA